MSLYQVIKLLKQNDDQIKSVTLVYNDKVKNIEKKINQMDFDICSFRIH